MEHGRNHSLHYIIIITIFFINRIDAPVKTIKEINNNKKYLGNIAQNSAVLFPTITEPLPRTHGGPPLTPKEELLNEYGGTGGRRDIGGERGQFWGKLSKAWSCVAIASSLLCLTLRSVCVLFKICQFLTTFV